MKRFLPAAIIGLVMLNSLCAENNFPVGEKVNLFWRYAVSNAWTNSLYVDLKNANAVTIRNTVDVTSTTNLWSFKAQWSDNRSNWVDEVVILPGTSNATEQPYLARSRVIVLVLTNGSEYTERFNRLHRFFRLSVKGDLPANTGKVSVIAQPLGN